jgi:UTP--glucose-1-phosphate uridylyltransferase
VVGDEPFVMLWGDDIQMGTPPVPRQLIDVAAQFGGPVIGVRKVARELFQKYGMVRSEPVGGRVGLVRSVVEKPKPEESPSDLAAIGGYVLTPDIFDLLGVTGPGLGGEIYLADAVAQLIESRPVYSYEFEGKRYDTGDKLDYLRANIELALNRPDLAPGLRALLAELDVAEPPSS